MVEQKLSIASLQDQDSPTTNAELIAEIGNNHIAFLVKNGDSINNFEVYEIKSDFGDWDGIFNATINQSKILDRTFSNTTIFINTSEALIVPAEKFRKESIEPFLSAVYGNSESNRCEAEIVKIPNNPATIYRCSLKLADAINKRFSNYTFRHTYTKILENLLGGTNMLQEMLKVQFYPANMVVTVISNNKLMLMQSYPYKSPEDVIYYLLNIVQEFSLNIKSTPVEVSGMIDISSKQFELLENVFGRLSFETLTTDSIFKDHISVANAHYYTPFVNLTL